MAGVAVRGGAGALDDVEVEVAAALGPFVVLFGEDGANESDDADDVVRRRISRLRRSLGLFDQI